MKNPIVFYALIAVGVVALIVGILYATHVLSNHPMREYAALGVGVVLIIAGIVGKFVLKPNAAA